MPEPSSMHSYFNWAKARIDEMDAVVASLEVKAGEIQAQSRPKADQLLAELRAKRDAFRDEAGRHAEAGEAAWQRAKARLESEWTEFETKLRSYVEDAGKQIGQQERAFQDASSAQLKAWREAADKFQRDALEYQATHRTNIDSAVQRMKAEASAAEARFQTLAKAGGQSWAALTSALADSRATFDRATQAACEAFRQATTEKPQPPAP